VTKKKRKTPVRHTVISHMRGGKIVNSFQRGKGKNGTKPTKRVIKNSKSTIRNSKLSKDKVLELLRVYQTNDYQRRDGRYPSHDRPDAIGVYELEDGVRIIFEFKDYAGTAERWVKANFLSKVKQKLVGTGWEVSRVQSRDVGDYRGDWAEVDIIVTEVK